MILQETFNQNKFSHQGRTYSISIHLWDLNPL